MGHVLYTDETGQLQKRVQKREDDSAHNVLSGEVYSIVKHGMKMTRRSCNIDEVSLPSPWVMFVY